MTLAGGFVIFTITWMVVLFTVLPWGIKTSEEANEPIEPGSAESAPVNPRIWTKFGITTVITSFLFAIVWATDRFDIVNYRDLIQ